MAAARIWKAFGEERSWRDRLSRLSRPTLVSVAAAAADRCFPVYQRWATAADPAGADVAGSAISWLWTWVEGLQPSGDVAELYERMTEHLSLVAEAAEVSAGGAGAEHALTALGAAVGSLLHDEAVVQCDEALSASFAALAAGTRADSEHDPARDPHVRSELRRQEALLEAVERGMRLTRDLARSIYMGGLAL